MHDVPRTSHTWRSAQYARYVELRTSEAESGARYDVAAANGAPADVRQGHLADYLHAKNAADILADRYAFPPYVAD